LRSGQVNSAYGPQSWIRDEVKVGGHGSDGLHPSPRARKCASTSSPQRQGSKAFQKEGITRMSASRRSFVQTVLGGMVAVALAGAVRGAGSETFSVVSIVILSREGPHRFRVELAESPSQRMQGLQGRRTLDADAGMLFVFDAPSVAAMWMKNTYIPLDMLFLDEVGNIVAIAENTRPMSVQPIQPPEPVKAVLELNAGTAARLGIKLGDRVLHPFVKTATSR
jgi:hypothetical protein